MDALGRRVKLKDRNYKEQFETRPAQPKEPERVTPERKIKIKPHRWCPACATGYGIANGRYLHSQRADIRYYKCNNCPHSWPYRIPIEERANFPPASEEG